MSRKSPLWGSINLNEGKTTAPSSIDSDDSLKDELYSELEKITASWKKTLLEALEDPITQENLSLLDAENQTRVHSFFKKRDLPSPLDSGTVHAIKQALENLEKVEISTYDLKKASPHGKSCHRSRAKKTL